MRIVSFLAVVLLSGIFAIPGFAKGRAKHVVMIVWDGMRPDFVTEQNTPTLWKFSRQGVTFKNHHSVYLSSTEVNGTALATGAYPVKNGIMGNTEYRPELTPLKSIHTEDLETVRKADDLAHGHYIQVPTIAETVRKNGGRTAVSGAKPVALLADRTARNSMEEGQSFFGGATLPKDLLPKLTNQFGAFPAANNTNFTRNDWTTKVLLDEMWAKGVPEYSLLWMNQPDYAQHYTGTGSKEVLAGIRNADDNLALVLKTLEEKGVRESTDVILVSDHGCSTISKRVDLVADLNKAGIKAVREFKTKPSTGDVLVVSNGGSTMVYVIGQDQKVIRQIVSFLQNWEYSGVIFTQKPMPGTFALSQVKADSVASPDVLISLRWTGDENKNETPGLVVVDVSGFGVGQGIHVSLSPYDMHNTLIAAGPDFQRGVTSVLPSGNVDIAPTVLWILGMKQSRPMDGRVLTEALTIQGPKLKSYTPHFLSATNQLEKCAWTQYLHYSEVNGVVYLDHGNGRQQSE